MICNLEHKVKVRHLNFTLIEIVTVLAIAILISGIALANLNLPIFASLDDTTKRVRQIFTEATTQTALQGVEIVVAYSSAQHKLLLYPASEEKDPDFSVDALMEQSGIGSSQYVLKIPSTVEVKFPDYREEDIKYRFFPDGSASGPEMTLTLKGKTNIVGISCLTGMAYSREETE